MLFKRTCLSFLAALVAVGQNALYVASDAVAKAVSPRPDVMPEPAVVVQPAKALAKVKPVVTLVSARSFVARLMRRARLSLTPGWRMCPSV